MYPNWITSALPRPYATTRLFCLPYAGGGVAHYRPWAHALDARIELCLVHLPGREQRLFDPPLHHIEPMAEALTTALAPWLDRAFAFFGHSMGALIAFETSRRLLHQGHSAPQHLFLSAHRAPHLPQREPPVYQLPDAAFIAKLRSLGGTPAEVLDNPELMELLLPTLRADFELSENYTYHGRARLDSPITVMGGMADSHVSEAELEAWRDQTNAPFNLRLYPGNHFYVHDAIALGVVAHINTLLR